MRVSLGQRLALVATLAFSLTACGVPAASLAPSETGAFAVQSSEDPWRVSTGNRVTPLIDRAEVFPAVLEAIRSAQRTVQIECFLLGGKVGREIAEALVERQKAGIEVQLLLDPKLGGIGSEKKDMQEVVAYLKANGVQVRTFAINLLPPGPRWLGRANTLAHAKLVAIDGKTAIVGGMNFSDGGADGHDFMARIEGPAALHVSEMIDEDFTAAGGPALQTYLTVERSFGAKVALAEVGPTRRNIRSLMVSQFNQAKRSIAVEALFLDHSEVIQSLIRAHQRGVNVRVLLDGDSIRRFAPKLPFLDKLPLDALGNLGAIADLNAAGVPVRIYVPHSEFEYLHAKLAMIDDQVTLVGSANFTFQATMRNREVMLAVEDASSTRSFMRAFEQDWASHSKPMASLSKFQKAIAALLEKVREGAYDPPKALDEEALAID
ncbi:Major cardiolipin synthase ClsA [compost metagenome]